MTGLSSLVLRRAAVSLDRNIVHGAARPANPHPVGLSPTFPPSPMLRNAVAEANKAAAANQQSRTSANRSLEKQLSPSSSPSAVPKKPQESVASMLSRPRPPPSSIGPSRTATRADALQSRPLNATRPNRSSVNGTSLASIYSKSDSFRSEPDVIDLLDHTPPPPSGSRASNQAPLVDIFESDIDDDDNLDLDFRANPPLPSLSRPQSRPAAFKPKDDPPPSTTSTLSWSQSSPSHLAPPKPRIAEKTAKRESPDNGMVETHIIKKPKREPSKRELPKHWAGSSTKAHDPEKVYEAAAMTPAPKAKAPLPWNTTASAIKAQKKQLKTQITGASKAEASMDDIREAIKSHVTATTSAITLSNEQRHVKSLVVEKGQSVFFTGPAGTGKSVLMRAIIQDLKKKYARDPERVAVTASTGLAACNIGGMTLHSFAGIGLGKEDANTLVKKIRRNPKAKTRWLKTKTLIIDEVSMLDGDLFDKLSQIGRILRNDGRPWGGIQLVITGDFFQLPPVPDGGKQSESKFAFDAATWNMSIDHTIGLTEVFRQKDPEFAAMLNEMRLGRISEQTVQKFRALSRPLQFDDGLEVTELFPTRHEVETSNQRRLQSLPGKSYRYEAMDTGDPKIRDKLLANMMAPPVIELKVGAQVMLIKNMDETLVNGSLGTVVEFMSESSLGIRGVGDDSDVESDAKKRIRAFESALSEGSNPDNKLYPMVRFHAVDGSQRHLLCVPEDWKVELPTGEMQASRKQLPLILAWALSIHKAQGQTLERVKVDLGKVFEKGQAYVALSRATSQEGLQVLRFQKDKIMAHPRVVEFYNKLYSAEAAVKKKAAGSITSYATKVTKQEALPRKFAGQQEDVFDEDEEEAMAAYG